MQSSLPIIITWIIYSITQKIVFKGLTLVRQCFRHGVIALNGIIRSLSSQGVSIFIFI